MKRFIVGVLLAFASLSVFAAGGVVTDSRGKPVVSSDGKPVTFDGIGTSSAGSSE